MVEGLAHLARSRYEEDRRPAGHASVWGSWFDAGSGRWGYACCRRTSRAAAACCSLGSDSAAESTAGPPAGAAGELAAVTDWRPREEFETAEGFVAHAARFFASRWRRWQEDGSAGRRAAGVDPTVAKVLISSSTASEVARGIEVVCERLGARAVPVELVEHLEEFCSHVAAREYAQANKAYMEIIMGRRKWLADVPYLVEGNRNGPSVVQNVAERLNKTNSNPLDEAGIRDHAVCLKRLLTVSQAVQPNEDPSKNCG
uniref:Prp18 domain-containing protein n=1 Tax=Alexandrium monilatum TaxID=311494 RepID=A0A6T1P4S8_9DINO